MKCSTHNSEAVGICTYCGRALCENCAAEFSSSNLKSSDLEKINPHAAHRLVCSDKCASALARDDRAMQLILQKSVQSARASAFYSFLCAVLSASGAIGAKYYLPSPFLIWFCTGCAAVFIASGIWFAVIAKKQS